MYLLSYEKIQLGDIVLTSQTNLISKSIRALTKSKYSHAILYVGDGSYIHSDKTGVHSGNTQRFLLEQPSCACVLRTKDSGIAQLACEFARTQVGKSYSVKEAVKTRLPTSTREQTNRQFCSKLVAQSYEVAGLPLVADHNRCTPQDLHDSPLTFLVSNCVKKATLEEIEFAKSESPIELQVRITNDILKKARKLAGADIQTLNQLTDFLLANRKYDQQITEIFLNSGYLTMWEYEAKKNKWRYDADIFMQLQLSADEKLSLARDELERATGRLERYKFNLEQCFYMKETTNLKYAHVNFELYKKLVEQAIDNIITAKYVYRTLLTSQ